VILAVTDALDDTANVVIAALRRRGARWARFNLAEFPRHARMAFNPQRAPEAFLVDEDGDTIPLETVRSVWTWHPQPPRLEGFEPPERAFLREASYCAWRLVSAHLRERCFMANDPWAERRAEDKGTQLRAAARAGLAIPETLVTNDPVQARAFCARHRETIFKLLNRPRIDRGDSAAWIGTRLLEPADLEALDDLDLCPGIFQPRIPKRFDLRVTVVGRRLFPVEIHSQGDPLGAVDFRPALADRPGDIPHVIHVLPPEVEERIHALTETLGLAYCAIDMVVTPAGGYVFLEVNPSGQYGWIEGLTGVPITAALVDMLLRSQP